MVTKKAGELKPGTQFKYVEKDSRIRVVVDKTSWIIQQANPAHYQVFYMVLEDGQIHWTDESTEVLVVE